jgi:PAS domain S-box-containing protein
MRLRTKTIVIVGLAVLGVIAALYFSSRIILLRGFDSIEHDVSLSNTERAVAALDNEASSLSTLLWDWSAWDDTYEFVEDLNQDYIEANLVEETFVALPLNIVLFVAPSGEIVFGKGFDAENEEVAPVPSSFLDHLKPGGLLLEQSCTEKGPKGIILLPEGPMMVASNPILNSSEEGPNRGTMIMGRYLDSSLAEKLSELSQLPLSFYAFGSSDVPPDVAAARSVMSTEEPIVTEAHGEEAITGYAQIEDIYGNVALIMGAEMARPIHEQGQTSRVYLLLSLLGVGLVCVALIYLILDRLVLSRLTTISEAVDHIGKSGDISARIPVKGADELAALAGDVNEMLSALENSRNRLLDSEARYRLLTENMTDVVCCTDMNMQPTYMSPSTQRLLGYTAEEAMNRTPMESMTPTSLEAAAEAFLAGTATAHLDEEGQFKRRSVEVELYRKDGSTVWADAMVSFLRDSEGKPTEMLMIMRDVSDRKKAEEALRQQEAYFRSLIEHATDAIAVVDQDGTIRYESPSVHSVLGYEPEELLGKSIFELVHPDDMEGVIAGFGSLMSMPGEGGTLEVRLRRKDGTTRVFEGTGRNLLNDPQVGGIVVNYRDISERRQAEEALKRQEEHFRSLIENSWDAIIILNEDGTTRYASPSVKRVLGYEPHEAIAGNRLDHIHPDDLLKLGEAFHQLLEAQGDIVQTEVRAKHKDGSWRSLDCTGHNLLQHPAVEGIVINCRDITDRKQTEAELSRAMAELERSNSELEQFAYVASHDLQEPLRMVSSYVQLLARRYKDKLDSEADEFIAFAVDGASRMQRLINDLLSYSRVTTRAKPFASTDCEEVIGQATNNLTVAIEESGALVTHDALPTVMGDESQLMQLLQNLMGNAIKFRGDEPPNVHISAKSTLHEWVFSVRDNGIGIDSEFSDRIFQIFQRLHTRDKYPGTGIGLAVCKRIVERHGGRIWVESQPGTGTTFSFTIPVIDPEDGEPSQLQELSGGLGQADPAD